MPELLHSFLTDQNVPCPGCGYNLRNSNARACPECNTPLVLALAPATSPRVVTCLRVILTALTIYAGIAATRGFWSIPYLTQVIRANPSPTSPIWAYIEHVGMAAAHLATATAALALLLRSLRPNFIATSGRLITILTWTIAATQILYILEGLYRR